MRVEGLRVKDPGNNQRMQEENGRLHPNLKIEQAAWLKSPKAMEGKTHASLILNVENAAQGKEIVQKGFVHQGTLLIAEHFQSQFRPTQCLQCNKFGHIAKHCKAPQICGLCSGPHRTDTCKEQKKRCCNCLGSHPAWSLACKVKQAAVTKARTLRAQAKGFWHPAPLPKETPDDGFIVVGTKRKAGESTGSKDIRRPPGRPLGTSASVMTGRAQGTKITNLFQKTGGQEGTQSSQAGSQEAGPGLDPMEDMPTHQNE